MSSPTSSELLLCTIRHKKMKLAIFPLQLNTDKAGVNCRHLPVQSRGPCHPLPSITRRGLAMTSSWKARVTSQQPTAITSGVSFGRAQKHTECFDYKQVLCKIVFNVTSIWEPSLTFPAEAKTVKPGQTLNTKVFRKQNTCFKGNYR